MNEVLTTTLPTLAVPDILICAINIHVRCYLLFDLHFSNVNVHAVFNVIIGHLYIFFGEVSINMCSPFLQ